MPVDISALYGRTWQLFRSNPRLWLISFLAALVGGTELGTSGTNLNSLSNLGDQSTTGVSPFDELVEPQMVVPIIIGAVICGIVLLIVFVVLGTITRGGLIVMTDALHAGEKPTVGACLRAGTRRAGAMFLTFLILGLPLTIALTVYGLITAFGTASLVAQSGDPSESMFAMLGGLFLCFLPVLLIVLVLSLLMNILGYFAGRLVVLEGMGPIASVRESWRMFRANVSSTLLAWISLGVPSAIASVALIVPVFAVTFGATFFIFSSTISGEFDPTTVGVFVVAVLLILAFSMFISTFIGAFVSQGWTVYYRSLRDRVVG